MPNNLENTDIRSEEVQDILEATPTWMVRWGNLVILFLIIGLFGLSYFIKYPDIITSEAMITTLVPPQKEYAKSSGKLQALLTQDNTYVSQGQALAVIENTANYQDVFYLESIIDTMTVNKKTFEFPINELPLLFLGDIEPQFAIFENNYAQYKFNKTFQPLSNETNANYYSVSETNRRLANLNTQKQSQKNILDYKLKDLNRQETLFSKGIISEQDYETKQLEIENAKNNYKTILNSISQLKEQLNNAQKNSKVSEFNKEKEDNKLLRNVIQSFNQLKKSIKEWRNRYILKSNINGTVSFLNHWTANQQVTQGDLVFFIIPSNNSSLIAKLKSPAQNSGKIKIGQKVHIQLENYPSTEFGVILGEINHISLIADKNGNYIIDVKLPSDLITSYNKHIDFKQEMKGAAEIITEDLRLLDRFFYQLKNAINH
jgi:multidrug resistance efflux pump